MATTNAEKMVLKLIDFEQVDINNVPLPVKKTKEERASEITINIITTTNFGEPIRVSYLVPPNGNNDSNDEDDDKNNNIWEDNEGRTEYKRKTIPGTAAKKDVDQWRIFLSDWTNFTVTETKLRDLTKFFVESTIVALNAQERKRQTQKDKRNCA